MAKHNETGSKGEQIAENFLLKKGYFVLYRNWRHEKKEIDLVASKDGLLIFVEVKTRKNSYFGFPEEAVTPQKIGYLKTAAEAFLLQFPEYTRIQFDIISIIMHNGHIKEIQHFEDAFY
jgi:putative endonuclease